MRSINGMRRPAALASLLLVVTACSTGTTESEEEPQAAEDITVGVVAGSAANPAVQVMNEASEERAEELGVELLTETSEGVEEQIEKAEAMIAQGVDYLGIHPWDGAAVVPLVESANSRGVKVVILIDGVPNVVEDGTALTFISGNERAAATQIGEWVVANYEGPTNAAIITGTPGNLSAENRTEGFKEGISGSPVSVVAEATANWARDQALRVAGDVVTANRDLNLIFANNDEMGFGALSAVQQAGLADQIDIIGWNGTCVGLEALLKGQFVLEAVLPFDEFGAGLIDVAIQDAEGEDVPPQVEPEVPVLTTQDAKDILAGSKDASESLVERLKEAEAGQC